MTITINTSSDQDTVISAMNNNDNPIAPPADLDYITAILTNYLGIMMNKYSTDQMFQALLQAQSQGATCTDITSALLTAIPPQLGVGTPGMGGGTPVVSGAGPSGSN